MAEVEGGNWLARLIGRGSATASKAELVRVEPDLKPSPELQGEQAGPSSWARNPYGAHPAAGLTPEGLAKILRSSIVADPERYLELAEDMEERFPQYITVMSTRKRQVAGLEFTVKPAGETPADLEEAAFVQEVIEGAKFRLSKVDQLDAIAKGFSCVEIIWDTSDGKWRPGAFQYRDPRFFKFDPVDPEHLMLKNAGGVEELIPHKWLVHRAKAKSGLTTRAGIARQVAWLYMFHSFNWKDWAIFAEAFGMPYRFGTYDNTASEGDKAALMQALIRMGTDGAGIAPTGSEIKFLEAGITGSTDLYERRAAFIDAQVSKIVLGQVGTTDAMKGGGYALGKVHDDVRDDIKDADAEQWAATLNEQLVPQLIGFNFAARARTGLPEICIGRPEEEDVKAWTDNVAKLVPMGLKVSQAEAQKKIGVTPPKDDDELLTAPKAAVPIDPLAEDGPPAPPAAVRAAAAALAMSNDDAIDLAVDETLADDGWQPMVSPLVDGLAADLAKVTSVDEAKAVLQRRAQTVGLTALIDELARATFQARLAGETDEDLR